MPDWGQSAGIWEGGERLAALPTAVDRPEQFLTTLGTSNGHFASQSPGAGRAPQNDDQSTGFPPSSSAPPLPRQFSGSYASARSVVRVQTIRAGGTSLNWM